MLRPNYQCITSPRCRAWSFSHHPSSQGILSWLRKNTSVSGVESYRPSHNTLFLQLPLPGRSTYDRTWESAQWGSNLVAGIRIGEQYQSTLQERQVAWSDTCCSNWKSYNWWKRARPSRVEGQHSYCLKYYNTNIWSHLLDVKISKADMLVAHCLIRVLLTGTQMSIGVFRLWSTRSFELLIYSTIENVWKSYHASWPNVRLSAWTP